MGVVVVGVRDPRQRVPGAEQGRPEAKLDIGLCFLRILLHCKYMSVLVWLTCTSRNIQDAEPGEPALEQGVLVEGELVERLQAPELAVVGRAGGLGLGRNVRWTGTSCISCGVRLARRGGRPLSRSR
jgi:hypothetical protein